MKTSYLYYSANWRRPGIFLLVFYVTANLILLAFGLTATDSFGASKILSPETHLEQGLRSFQQGDFEQAVLRWSEAARLYEKEGKLGLLS